MKAHAWSLDMESDAMAGFYRQEEKRRKQERNESRAVKLELRESWKLEDSIS